ncbi:hypothetical protein HYDPIDRAFT_117048 [Hydnomerulius pinastri MD-312]|uniref:Uncharacterized protein n=1 Tax=Hydnomerulius pinastri MD-312 TaxID=994086 RepID=A0A0C9WB43_9AGAM|nr:hypothetical protein HYDPIDRAFT_117048 [Hydnomerulius pinastri MD-312]
MHELAMIVYLLLCLCEPSMSMPVIMPLCMATPPFQLVAIDPTFIHSILREITWAPCIAVILCALGIACFLATCTLTPRSPYRSDSWPAYLR